MIDRIESNGNDIKHDHEKVDYIFEMTEELTDFMMLSQKQRGT